MKDDETLVRDYQKGDIGAIEDLCQRYQAPLWHYVRRLSWYRDNSFIDDIIQIAWATTLKGLKNGQFMPAGEGSFKKLAYKICQNVCWNENKKRVREAKPVSERYPEKVPDDLRAVRSQPTKDYHNLRARLYALLEHLLPEDQQLILLLKENKTYKEIQQIPPFNKYSLTSLRQKVCRIRQWLIRLRKEERNEAENN